MGTAGKCTRGTGVGDEKTRQNARSRFRLTLWSEGDLESPSSSLEGGGCVRARWKSCVGQR